MVQHDSTSTKQSVPYVPFPTFITALDYLKVHGIPENINPSVFQNMSGGLTSHLLLALKFFGAIDDKGNPQPSLSDLVDEKTRKQSMAKLIPQRYAELFTRVDLAKASPASLNDALREANVSGATQRKARAFLIKAAQFSGLPVSAYLTKRTRKSGPRVNGSARKIRQVTEDKSTEKQIQPGLWYTKIIHFPQAGGLLTLSGDIDPLNLRGSERDLFYALADLMSDFEAKNETASK